jgi:general L-amino acid transport system substrate-binding protein
MPSFRTFAKAVASAATILACGATSAGAQTLEAIKQRGRLICGSHLGLPGFGAPDTSGQWRGLDVEFCRALSAAIFNDPAKVAFVPLTPKDRFTAVQLGGVDILSRNATYTLSRDTQLALNFPAITFFDGQGFLVRKALNVKSVRDLNGATICLPQGTTTELNAADYFRANAMTTKTVTFATNEEAVRAMADGRCDAYTTDRSGLASERLKFNNPNDFIILPETISKEPLGPAIRQGDEQWSDIVRWTHYAMLNAEELGVKQANVDEMLKSTNPEIRRLLGVEAKMGEMLGLSNDWVYRIVKHVGNYGESYERNLGLASPLKIERGRNALADKGGLQYPYPIR